MARKVGLTSRRLDTGAAEASFEAGYRDALGFVRERVEVRLRERATALVAAPVSVDPQASYDEEWWATALALYLAGRYNDFLDEAEEAVADGLGVDIDDPVVADAAADAVDELLAQARAQAPGQRQWVVDKIAAAVAAGEGVDEMVAAAVGDTGPLAPDRAPLLAGLAVAATWNVAALAVALAAGKTDQEKATEGSLFKRWVTRADDRVRDEHADMEGQTVPVGDDFDMDGYACARPGDERLPVELVAGCRCYLALSREDGAEPEEVALDVDALTASSESVLFVESAAEWHTHGKCPRCGGYLTEVKHCHWCGDGYKGPVTEAGHSPTVDPPSDGSDTIEANSDAGAVAPSGVPQEDTRMEPTAAASTVTHKITPDQNQPLTLSNTTGTAGFLSGAATLTTSASNTTQLVAMGQVPWRGVIAIEGKPTGDGRLFRRGALYWETLPVDLFVMLKDPEGGFGHDGSEIGGRVDRMWKVDNPAGYAEVWGEGIFDTATEAGAEAARLQGNGMLTGVSIDVDSVEYEMPDLDDVDIIDILLGGVEEYTAGRIRRITVCSIPAFIEARIFPVADDGALVASGPAGLVKSVRAWQPWPGMALVASPLGDDRFRSPIVDHDPPADVFKRQSYGEYTPMTVDAQGRLAGHVSPWRECHIGFTDRCVTAPRSANGYRHACTGHTLTADGQLVATARIFGQFTPGRRGHAPLNLGNDAAVEWYENMTACLADVAVYEDNYGIQVQGRVRPGVTADRVAALRGSDVSPDWRSIGGRLECVGFAAVNTSGFPNRYSRLPALVASGVNVRVPEDGEVVAGVFVKAGEVASLVASPVRMTPSESATAALADQVAALIDAGVTLAARVEALELEVLTREKDALLAGLPSEEEELARLAAEAADLLAGVDLGEPAEAQENAESTVADTQGDGPEPAAEVVVFTPEERAVLRKALAKLHGVVAQFQTCDACGWKNVSDEAKECPNCGADLAGKSDGAVAETVTASASCSCGGSCGGCSSDG